MTSAKQNGEIKFGIKLGENIIILEPKKSNELHLGKEVKPERRRPKINNE